VRVIGANSLSSLISSSLSSSNWPGLVPTVVLVDEERVDFLLPMAEPVPTAALPVVLSALMTFECYPQNEVQRKPLFVACQWMMRCSNVTCGMWHGKKGFMNERKWETIQSSEYELDYAEMRSSKVKGKINCFVHRKLHISDAARAPG